MCEVRGRANVEQHDSTTAGRSRVADLGWEPGRLGALLFRGTAGTLGLRVGGAGLSFVASVLLARLLGATDYGTYYYIMAFLALLAIAAELGLPAVITREVAACQGRGDWRRLRGVVRFARGITLGASALVGLGALGLAATLGEEITHIPLVPLALALLLFLPIRGLIGVITAVQVGFQRVIAGGIPESTRWLVFVAALGVVWLFSPARMNLTAAVSLQVVAATFALIVAMFLQAALRRDYQSDLSVKRPEYYGREWLAAGVPLMLLAGMVTINNNADILMLGGIVDSRAAGLYYAATRGANLISLVFGATIVPLGPIIARLYAAADTRALQRMLSRSTRLVTLVSLPIALLFILEGGLFLRLFGAEFVTARWALAVLSAAQLFVVASGPVALVLVMTGHERVATWGVGVGTFVNVALNAALIPVMGIEGAAIATGASYVISNALLIWEVKRRIGIRATILAGFRA